MGGGGVQLVLAYGDFFLFGRWLILTHGDFGGGGRGLVLAYGEYGRVFNYG